MKKSALEIRRPIKKKENSNRMPSKETTSGSDETLTSSQVKILFEDLFIDSNRLKVNPFNCVPFTKIRPVSTSGVRRLASIFDYGSDTTEAILPGLTIGSDLPMVIELKGANLKYVREFLLGQGMKTEEVEKRLAQQDNWYGIIDGNHCNQAIRFLMMSKPEWRNFEWTVLSLNGAFSIERYKQLARANNARQDKIFYVEQTFFDELYNLKSEYDRIVLEQSKPTHTDVARAYFGCNTVNRTMTLMSSTAIRLSPEVLKTLGEITYSEHPGLCLSCKEINSFGATNEDMVMEKVDCRLYRNFVNLTSLRQSTIFMNPSN